MLKGNCAEVMGLSSKTKQWRKRMILFCHMRSITSCQNAGKERTRSTCRLLGKPFQNNGSTRASLNCRFSLPWKCIVFQFCISIYAEVDVKVTELITLLTYYWLGLLNDLKVLSPSESCFFLLTHIRFVICCVYCDVGLADQQHTSLSSSNLRSRKELPYSSIEGWSLGR